MKKRIRPRTSDESLADRLASALMTREALQWTLIIVGGTSTLSGIAAAQVNETAVCAAPILPGLVSAIYSLILAGGFVTGLLGAVASRFYMTVTFNQERQQQIKQWGNGALKAAISIYGAVGAAWVLVAVTDIPWPSCIGFL